MNCDSFIYLIICVINIWYIVVGNLDLSVVLVDFFIVMELFVSNLIYCLMKVFIKVFGLDIFWL